MASARVTLLGCLSFQPPRGAVWKKGESRIITDKSNPGIGYYQINNEFVVTPLADATPQPSAPPKAEEPLALTQAGLLRMSKAELVELAKDRFDLELESETRKDDMVLEILKVQG